MVDVLVDTEDITVLGGPDSIDVDLDVGPSGERGSRIFTSVGDPNIVSIGGNQTFKIFDLCINVNPSDPDYQFLYQRISNSGNEEIWEKIFKMTTNQYSETESRTFVAGKVDIIVNLIDIVPEDMITTVQSSDFAVMHNISGSQNPIASSILIGDIVTNGTSRGLPITVNGASLQSGIWSDLSGNLVVHLFISMV
jgi:hypothetical protein